MHDGMVNSDLRPCSRDARRSIPVPIGKAYAQCEEHGERS